MISLLLPLFLACDPGAALPSDGADSVVANVPDAAHPALDADVRAALGTPAVDDRFALADGVFLGEVIRLDYRMSEATAESEGVPFTFVTWRVEKAWKGTAAGEEVTARIVGGPMPGNRVLAVSEQPVFQDGDRDVIFLDSHLDGASPILGGNAGRYRLLEGGVFTDEGGALAVSADDEISVVGHHDFAQLDVMVIGSAAIEREHDLRDTAVGAPAMGEADFVRFLDARLPVVAAAPHVVNQDASVPFTFAFATHRFSN